MLTVFVYFWDLEDSREVLRVGQRVEWRLTFDEGPDGRRPEHVQEVRGSVSRLTSWEGTPLPPDTGACGLSLASGGTLYWAWPPPPALEGEVTVTGTVQRDGPQNAPDDFPLTSGVIRRIRMETQMADIRMGRVVHRDDPPLYEAVEESYFPPLHRPNGQMWTGVLVHLDDGDDLGPA